MEQENKTEQNPTIYPIFVAAAIGSAIGVLPTVLTTLYLIRNNLDDRIVEVYNRMHDLKPIVREEQVLGAPTPEKFYRIDGRNFYFEIDGKPVEEYFAERTKIE